MNDFLFFAVLYGAAASIAVLQVGAPLRWFFSSMDRGFFPGRWEPGIPEERRGGPLHVLIHCPACVSFWLALALSGLVYSPAGAHFGVGRIIGMPLDGFASVGIIWFVQVVMTKLGQYGL